MGQCAAICSNTTKKFCEVNVEHISTHLSKRNSLLKYSSSPFYSNIIFLQIQIRKFLKRIKKKKSDKNNYINVNINVNNNIIKVNTDNNQLLKNNTNEIKKSKNNTIKSKNSNKNNSIVENNTNENKDKNEHNKNISYNILINNHKEN